jgi:hypothetical protein
VPLLPESLVPAYRCYGVQSLARDYGSDGGQVAREDDYFNLSGLTYSTAHYVGTAGTNSYSTLFDYDHDGRPNRTQLPTGTIERQVRDGLGRVVSTWICTNDTPASGYWSPTNNTAPANMVPTPGPTPTASWSALPAPARPSRAWLSTASASTASNSKAAAPWSPAISSALTRRALPPSRTRTKDGHQCTVPKILHVSCGRQNPGPVES